MKIGAINPFIRYVSLGNQRAINDWVKTYDERLFYILDGECSLCVANERFSLTAHTLVLVKAGTAYRFENARDIQMLILNFDYTRDHTQRKEVLRPLLLKDYDENQILEKIDFEDFPAFNQPIVMKDMQAFERALREVVELYNTPNLFREELASAKLKVFFCRFAERIAYTFSGVHSLVDKALEFIKTHYHEEITNTDVGEYLGYHSYYINRLMLTQTGKSIHQHLLSQRLETAKELLVSDDMPISEIAERCGFSCIAVFSAFFKERTEIPPTTFRKRFANRL